MLPTANQIELAVGCARAIAQAVVEPMRETCRIFEIDTAPRLAAFMAQTGHECTSYTQLVEDLRYRAETIRKMALANPVGSRWRSLYDRAEQLAGHPERLANAVYGGRMGNGPESSGDGWRYRGRGWIGNTGKAAYDAITELLMPKLGGVPDFTLHPELLESHKWASLAAGAFWDEHELNDLADRGDLVRMTKIINGGKTGLPDRQARYARAAKVFVS